MNKPIQNPCLGCTRVADPENCELRRCNQWEKWFLHRWSQIHGFYLKWLQENGGEK